MIFFLYFFFLLYIEFFHRISSSPILLEHLSHHYTQQRAKKKTDSLLRSALRSRTPIDTTFLLPAAHRNGRATSSPSNLHSSCNKVASLLRINDPRKPFCFRPINPSDRFLAATISPFYSSGNNNLSSPSVSTLFLFEKENRREMKFLFHFISR